jgi:protein gp37
MMARTKIELTDETWNPVHGCTKISSGCRNCYAERMSRRLAGRYGYPPTPDNFKVTLRHDRLVEPLKWRKPRMVFVCSMGDLFHRNVDDDFLNMVFGVMLMGGQHTFQVLTKRPHRVLDFLTTNFRRRKVWESMRGLFFRLSGTCGRPMNYGDVIWPLPNVWLGVTAENQQTADERIPLLLQTPAAVRFVSCEPLLGPISLQEYIGASSYDWWSESGPVYPGEQPLDWTIVGGETGPGARPTHPDWFRSLRDQCQAAGMSYFHKQNGEWQGADQSNDTLKPSTPEHVFEDGTICFRVGKKRAGHLLDGREWREMPEVKK